MPDIDDVRRRLRTDPDFKAALVRDPKAALHGFELSPEDLSTITAELSQDHAALDPVEQRTSKAGLFSLLSSAMSRPGAARAHDLDFADVSGFTAPIPAAARGFTAAIPAAAAEGDDEPD